MALTQRLQIRQSQALVMTPQLMQAIKLLQLSNLDLIAYVEAELERNPLLERGNADGEAAARRQRRASADKPAEPGETWNGSDSEPSGRPSRSAPTTTSTTLFPMTPSRAAAHADAPGGYSEWAGVGTGGRDDGDYNLEAFVSAETTLADQLREQLTLAIVDPVRRMIGHYLIDLVDEAGYLSGDLAPVAEKLGAGVAEIEAVLGILQTFDPPGVCARNLAECLAIQLQERDRFDPAMAALVDRSTSSPGAISPRCRKSAGSTTRTSPT